MTAEQLAYLRACAAEELRRNPPPPMPLAAQQAVVSLVGPHMPKQAGARKKRAEAA